MLEFLPDLVLLVFNIFEAWESSLITDLLTDSKLTVFDIFESSVPFLVFGTTTGVLTIGRDSTNQSSVIQH